MSAISLRTDVKTGVVVLTEANNDWICVTAVRIVSEWVPL